MYFPQFLLHRLWVIIRINTLSKHLENIIFFNFYNQKNPIFRILINRYVFIIIGIISGREVFKYFLLK